MNVIFANILAAIGLILIIGVLLSPAIYTYYKSIGVDPICLEDIGKSFCEKNNFTLIYKPTAEHFYCRGEVNERLNPEGERIMYYFTKEEQLSCKVKEENSFRSLK